MEYHTAINKDELLITCGEMDYLRNIMKSEGSQAQEHILFDFVYIIGKPIYKADRG